MLMVLGVKYTDTTASGNNASKPFSVPLPTDRLPNVFPLPPCCLVSVIPRVTRTIAAMLHLPLYRSSSSAHARHISDSQSSLARAPSSPFSTSS